MKRPAKKKSAIERAVEVAGSGPALARLIGVTSQAVWLWRQGGTISAERALEIERATGILRSDLRPDLPWTKEAVS